MSIHFIFDLLSYSVAFLISWKWIRPATPAIADETLRYGYYTALIIGFFIGAFGFGTLNTYYSLHQIIIGKSVLGAIFGGVVSAELFKKFAHIRGSTGAYFVPSLSIGIAIGRIGCYLSGIQDYTYGIETTTIFAHDFGDGIMRHPVQLYESVSMGLFFLYTVWVYKNNKKTFEHTIFYQFIGYYSLQRFVWEFLKPYETLIFGLTLFQILCLILMVYAFIYLQHKKGKL
ncbi:prolipoprotein diacylglyceryl transferase family protein [Sulfuricurvum sp.]|uniref:prolipoprotein diacylglyceryl transferase n=2 Tax=Sulfuricurvum sp. TaxID=2025608 RepID=UPI0026059F29|nr:prolipoprotein diacylglyceryl transferase family protein [Sulfuricurvum sp.]MDD4949953.1 prolipoprotein diacylglyceryl transferase [Sulfuricurvum sp.]